ncbi:MAG TPA: hypothetical protein ENG87_04610 [Candidatus Pacearchaeota archaeon]|nr:hypothetical protein BMS3Abin17_00891 [archaeon BMS3Abin17]HDK42638.1 hypothetical protein [Candidatus Pacearchaeota archaeon]HDZ61374.1 hypothetical protein [Candidatus Pacearchaeota archaeon]
MVKQKRTLRNVLFTILIAFAIVSFWRGVWGLMDLYLAPHNLVLSFFLSILIGILILYATKNLIRNLI